MIEYRNLLIDGISYVINTDMCNRWELLIFSTITGKEIGSYKTSSLTQICRKISSLSGIDIEIIASDLDLIQKGGR